MNIKLNTGRAVRDPVKGTYLPVDQVVTVPDSFFWQRRVRDGDVSVVKDASSETSTTATLVAAAAQSTSSNAS